MLMQSILGTFRYVDSQRLLPGVFSGNAVVRNVVSIGGGAGTAGGAAADPLLGGAPQQQQGLCEQFSAFNTCYNDTGLFGVYGVCTGDILKETVEELMFGITRREARNTPFCPSQEKFHTAVFEGFRSISDVL